MEQEQIKKKGKIPDRQEKQFFSIVRIMQTDIPGNKRILVGLTYIKGISWSISNAMCRILKMDPNKKVLELTGEEISKIENFLKKPELPVFLMNRRNDFETGENSHLTTTQLDIVKEFDIRRIKKIRTYRGLRHSLGQPTRGQSTRSHFRSKKKGKSVGVTKKKAEPKPASKESGNASKGKGKK